MPKQKKVPEPLAPALIMGAFEDRLAQSDFELPSGYSLEFGGEAASETRLRRIPKTKGFIHLKATIDGTDSIFFTTDHVQWMHAKAGMPAKIQINGVNWDIAKSPSLTNRGVTQILSFDVAVSTARLTKFKLAVPSPSARIQDWSM